LPCFAELTKEDVRQIIREEIEPMKKEIEFVKIEIATIKGDIKALEGKMATKDDLLSIWKDMAGKIEVLYGLIIGVLLAIIVSVILPPVLQKWLESRKPSRKIVRTGDTPLAYESDEERFQRIEAELEELKAVMKK
jgi:tetrahydromethanopterin S-methyltransferase subunit G